MGYKPLPISKWLELMSPSLAVRLEKCSLPTLPVKPSYKPNRTNGIDGGLVLFTSLYDKRLTYFSSLITLLRYIWRCVHLSKSYILMTVYFMFLKYIYMYFLMYKWKNSDLQSQQTHFVPGSRLYICFCCQCHLSPQ